MGQIVSHERSEDTLDLFRPISGSTTSITNSYEQEDVVIENSERCSTYQLCGKITQMKKSLSECFRSSRWQEMKNDSVNFEEYAWNDDLYFMEFLRSGAVEAPLPDRLVPGQSPQKQSNDKDVILAQDFPHDIHEIHDQLKTLMLLLTAPEANLIESDKCDAYCQTNNAEDNLEHMLRQRDLLISNHQDTVRHFQMQLCSKNQIIERYSQELVALKAQQTRQRLDVKNVSHLVTFLRGVREGGVLDPSDVHKMDEVIEFMASAARMKNCPLDNVAVINPCCNINTDEQCLASPSILVPLQSGISGSSLNPFVKKSTNTTYNMETKLICFLENSVTPYISNIPISASGITLSDVKNYTKSVLPKNANCRYIFRSTTSSCEKTQEEIYRDSDKVPVQDNKIMVRIRM